MGKQHGCTRSLIAAVFALTATLSALGSAPTTADSPLAPEPVPVERLPYIFDIAVDRADSSYLLLATSAGLYRASMDGTAVLVSSQRNSIWSLALNPSDPSIIYAAGVSDEGQSVGIHISRDRGHTWHRLGNAGSELIYFRVIDVSAADPAVVYGVGYRLWASQDGAGAGSRPKPPRPGLSTWLRPRWMVGPFMRRQAQVFCRARMVGGHGVYQKASHAANPLLQSTAGPMGLSTPSAFAPAYSAATSGQENGLSPTPDSMAVSYSILRSIRGIAHTFMPFSEAAKCW